MLLKAEKANESVHMIVHVPSVSADCLRRWSQQYRRIVERLEWLKNSSSLQNSFQAQNDQTRKRDVILYSVVHYLTALQLRLDLPTQLKSTLTATLIGTSFTCITILSRNYQLTWHLMEAVSHHIRKQIRITKFIMLMLKLL